MKRKVFILAVLVFLAGGLVLLGINSLRLGSKQQLAEEIVSEGEISLTPTPSLLVYINQEFDFKLSHSFFWGLPEEKKITPPEQHLCQIILDPKGKRYLIDIYDQPSPISLGSFVRGYFQGVEWSKEIEINGQEALKFFLSQSGLKPEGIGAVAFRKGSYILVISTPILGGNREEIVEDKTLNDLTGSLQWVE